MLTLLFSILWAPFSRAKTGYKRIGSVFREQHNENCREEEQMPRERTTLAGSHCAIKTVIAMTSFTAIKMVLDLDKGHKERNGQGQREGVQKFSGFSSSIQQSHQHPWPLAVGSLGVQQSKMSVCLWFLSDRFYSYHFGPNRRLC